MAIHTKTDRYMLETQGNGLFVTITRLSDDASVFLQGEEAVTTLDDVDTIPPVENFDDMFDYCCSRYDEIMQPRSAD